MRSACSAFWSASSKRPTCPRRVARLASVRAQADVSQVGAENGERCRPVRRVCVGLLLCQSAPDALRLLCLLERVLETADVAEGVGEIAERSRPVRRVCVGLLLCQSAPDALGLLRLLEGVPEAADVTEVVGEVVKGHAKPLPVIIFVRPKSNAGVICCFHSCICGFSYLSAFFQNASQ